MNNTDIPDVSGEPTEAIPAAAPEIPAGRDRRGRFQKGAPSANPRGRPVENLELKELCRLEGPASVRVIKAIRDDQTHDPQVRLAASKALLDRGFGRPEQGVTVAATIANYSMPFAGAVETVSGHVEAMNAYQQIIQGRDPRSVEIVSAREPALVALDLPPLRPVLVPTPQPISRAEPTETVQARTSAEPRTDDQESAPGPSSTMSQKTRELWEKLGRPANPEEGIAALDKILRHQRKPYIAT